MEKPTNPQPSSNPDDINLWPSGHNDSIDEKTRRAEPNSNWAHLSSDGGEQ